MLNAPIQALAFAATLPLLLCASLLQTGCGSSSNGGGGSSGDRAQAGGDTTVQDRTTLAFESPAPNLSDSELDIHLDGDAAFDAVFVTPPALFNAGLGPFFNNSSCGNCHTKNGRGQPVFGTGALGSQALLRLSGSVEQDAQGPTGFGTLGTQLQDHAVFGLAPEGAVSLTWETITGSYPDGSGYELRRPQLKVTLADGSQLPASALVSMRVPPPVFGLGLLEAVPEAVVLEHADPEDMDGDGISGRPNYVWDVVSGSTQLGRFGLKANQPNLLQQAAAAYRDDIGVSNDLFPESDGSTDLDAATLAAAEFYVQSLAVPGPTRLNDPTVQRGEQLFADIQCASCHLPRMRTGQHPLGAVSNQTIFAYTDLLLHDMGPELADNRPDFLATGSEWRTTPLWSIGVTKTILSVGANFLHDGRARTFEEAILWHGGEAEQSREVFKNLPKADRDAIISFLDAL